MALYLVDFISADGQTAHLYPHADRADSPRVAGKYITRAASTLNPVALPTPVNNSSSGEMPQLVGGQAYGYIDLQVTRVGLGGGNIAFYRNVSTADRWELNTNTATVSSFRVYERTTAGGALNRLTVTGQFAADQTRRLGVRMDEGGHTFYMDGAEIGRYATIGAHAAEATVQGVTTSGISVGAALLYPLTVEISEEVPSYTITGTVGDTPDGVSGLVRVERTITGTVGDTPDGASGFLQAITSDYTITGTVGDTPDRASGGLSVGLPTYTITATVGDTPDGASGSLGVEPPPTVPTYLTGPRLTILKPTHRVEAIRPTYRIGRVGS